MNRLASRNACLGAMFNPSIFPSVRFNRICGRPSRNGPVVNAYFMILPFSDTASNSSFKPTVKQNGNFLK